MTLAKKTAVSMLSAALLLGNISTFNYGVSSKITLAQEEKKMSYQMFQKVKNISSKMMIR